MRAICVQVPCFRVQVLPSREQKGPSVPTSLYELLDENAELWQLGMDRGLPAWSLVSASLAERVAVKVSPETARGSRHQKCHAPL